MSGGDVHVVVVAEATPGVANMLRLLGWSLRTRGGTLANAPVTAVFNEREDPEVSRELTERYGFRTIVRPRISTSLRFTNKWNCLEAPLGGARWMLFLDWDIAVCAPLDPLLHRLRTEGQSAGFFISPEFTRQAWGLRGILKKHAGLTDARLDEIAHDWYPADRMPVFNTGVFALRADHIDAFRREIVPMCDRLHRSMRATSLNPWQWLKVQWNRRHWKKPDADRRIVGSFFPRVHAGQIAVPTTILKLGIPSALLTHVDNWRAPTCRFGDEAGIRLLHYMGSRFPEVDKARLFDGHYFERFENSDNEGWRALVELVRAYNAAGGVPHRADPDRADPTPVHSPR